MSAVIAALASCSRDSCALELGLKWPNDLVAWENGRLVKLGGIIGETAKGCIVFGVGVNLSDAPAIPGRSIPPSCLAWLGARLVPDSLDLARNILSRWQDLESAPEPLFRWPGEGDGIRWETGQGVCMGWAQDGRLEVRTDKGLERLSVGDVSGLIAE